MGVYDRQIALALRMIKAKGQLCTWVQYTPGIGGTLANPVDDIATEYANTPILFLPQKQTSLATALSLLVGSEVPTGGMRALMPRVSFNPTLKDMILRNGEELGISDRNGIDVLAPNGDTILYYLNLVR
jgi:hypothetical protein